MQRRLAAALFLLTTMLTATAGEPCRARAAAPRSVEIELPEVTIAVAPAEPLGEEVAAPAPAAPETQVPEPQVMASFLTSYELEGRAAARAHNVALAAERLDGAVIAPGETLSFNEVVGERSAERGFVAAPVIANGHVRRGLGGGVCQVSTTLHNAALRAGLSIVEHHAHSVPSHYVEPGLDATVSWGELDYRISNPYPFPVEVHAQAEAGRMRVTLTGAEAGNASTVRVQRLRTVPAPERVVHDSRLAAGEREVERPGHEGTILRVIRVDSSGHSESEQVEYAAAARVVRVGEAL